MTIKDTYKLKVEGQNKEIEAEIEDSFVKFLNARAESIEAFEAAASDFDEAAKVVKGLNIGGAAVCITGSLVAVAGGIASIVTAGAAIPFLIGGLVWSGFGVGVVGGGLKIGGTVHEFKAREVIVKKLDQKLREDIENYNSFISKIEKLKSSDSIKFTLLKSNVSTLGCGLLALGTEIGVIGIVRLINQVAPPLSKLLITNATLNKIFQTILASIMDPINESVAEIVITTSSTTAEKIAANAVKDLPAGVVKNTAQKTAQIAVGEVLKNGSDEAAQAAAQTAVTSTVKTAARIAGGVTIGLSVVFIVWDSILIYQEATKKTLGDYLREIAEELKKSNIQKESPLKD